MRERERERDRLILSHSGGPEEWNYDPDNDNYYGERKRNRTPALRRHTRTTHTKIQKTSEWELSLAAGSTRRPWSPLILGRLPGLPGGEPPNTSVRYSHLDLRSINPGTETRIARTQNRQREHRAIAGQLTSRRWFGGPWVGISDPGRAPK